MNKKVLVISNTPFSEYNNNGKTYSSIFEFINKENLAQLYFNNSVPSFRICDNYYKISDSDILRNIFKRRNVGNKVVRSNVSNSNTDVVIANNKNKFTNKLFRSDLAKIFRDSMWKLSSNKFDEMYKWIDEFNPDSIFFVGGGDVFSYRIVTEILRRRDEKTVLNVYYTDDYIENKKKSGSLLMKIFSYNKKFFTEVDKILKKSSNLFVISEKMKNKYAQWYSGNIEVIMNSIDFKISNFKKRQNRPLKLAYFGGLHLGRWETVKDLVEKLDSEGIYFEIDLFVNERTVGYINKINSPNVNRKAFLSDPNELFEVMKTYDFLIQIESYDSQQLLKTLYSISTKVPEYLSTKVPILVSGPREQASIEYLLCNDACTFIDKNSTQSEVKELLSTDLLSKRVENGYELLIKNHLKSSVHEKLQGLI